jgi:hypothetical protein
MPCADTRRRGAALYWRLAVNGIHWDSMSFRGTDLSIPPTFVLRICLKLFERPAHSDKTLSCKR